MKIKYNIPKLNELKKNVKNIVTNIKNNKAKANLKYFMLLFLMIMLGIFTINLNNYRNSKKEKYTKYDTYEDVIVSNSDANKESKTQYETAVSSISTKVEEAEGIKKEDSKKGEQKNNNDYIMPVDGEILKEYAKDKLIYSKTLEMWKVHLGIDIKAEIGTKVKSVASGEIIEISKSQFYGNTVKIKHSDELISVYSNLDNDVRCKLKENVNKGDIIGTIGATSYGEIADESHLHFEILKNKEQIDPTQLLGIQE